ncbi:hypothetical protein Ddye_005233 [Dipteronia dyeriana]|uniref:MULE transposase domain-containing protein n=1 Tax=Dipteronia dyeriana TaxID=168575 RepID=A0AAD9XG34_9ROSI|nr:hypothetical protein Ddye_005233 [Dipteronia dyeriana]
MHEETFQLLSSFGYVLEQKSLGTITDLQCDENGKFLYLFKSLGASIRGFQRCMHPVIVVGGTHLKGRFGGTMFVTTAQDRNVQVYPIAFRYGDSKNNLSWEWFLNSLKGALGHIDDLVFISDRHASIKAGISKVFPYTTHTICCWHFYENIKIRYHRKDVTAIMDKAVRAYTKLQYNWYMEELRNLHLNAYDYVINAGPYKWSRVHCPDRRYRVRAELFMRNTSASVASVILLATTNKHALSEAPPWNDLRRYDDDIVIICIHMTGSLT